MFKNTSKKSLLDAYQFDGFKTLTRAKGRLGDRKARVIVLARRQKKVFAPVVVNVTEVGTIEKQSWSEIFPVVIGEFIWNLRFDACGVERLAW